MLARARNDMGLVGRAKLSAAMQQARNVARKQRTTLSSPSAPTELLPQGLHIFPYFHNAQPRHIAQPWLAAS